MSGSIKNRLAALETAARNRAAPTREPDRTEVEWLATFADLGAAGSFDREPDFPKALALYRECLARAMASTDPPWEVPREFMRTHPDPGLRVSLWRGRDRFPELAAADEWLYELLHRVAHDEPPVTEREFAELAVWFRANDDRLAALGDQLDVGRGRRTEAASIRFGIAKGPRCEGAGETAEDCRQMRARYGK